MLDGSILRGELSSVMTVTEMEVLTAPLNLIGCFCLVLWCKGSVLLWGFYDSCKLNRFEVEIRLLRSYIIKLLFTNI